jgi:hypothetical protein
MLNDETAFCGGTYSHNSKCSKTSLYARRVHMHKNLTFAFSSVFRVYADQNQKNPAAEIFENNDFAPRKAISSHKQARSSKNIWKEKSDDFSFSVRHLK